MAPTAPGAVEFHIHHVVPVFQTSIEIKQNKKKRIRRSSFSAKEIKGIHAKKIRKVKGETGHAKTSKIPLRILIKREKDFLDRITIYN
jgi:uncharacterized Zn finger protein